MSYKDASCLPEARNLKKACFTASSPSNLKPSLPGNRNATAQFAIRRCRGILQILMLVILLAVFAYSGIDWTYLPSFSCEYSMRTQRSALVPAPARRRPPGTFAS